MADVRFGAVSWGKGKPQGHNGVGTLSQSQVRERGKVGELPQAGPHNKPLRGDPLGSRGRAGSPSQKAFGRPYFVSPRTKVQVGAIEQCSSADPEAHTEARKLQLSLEPCVCSGCISAELSKKRNKFQITWLPLLAVCLKRFKPQRQLFWDKKE